MEEKIFNAFREAMDNDALEINLSDHFREYEDWDSLAYLSMIATLDEEFGIEVEDETFKMLETVEDLLKVVTERAAVKK
jgi:acyl carrier protein